MDWLSLAGIRAHGTDRCRQPCSVRDRFWDSENPLWSVDISVHEKCLSCRQVNNWKAVQFISVIVKIFSDIYKAHFLCESWSSQIVAARLSEKKQSVDYRVPLRRNTSRMSFTHWILKELSDCSIYHWNQSLKTAVLTSGLRLTYHFRCTIIIISSQTLRALPWHSPPLYDSQSGPSVLVEHLWKARQTQCKIDSNTITHDHTNLLTFCRIKPGRWINYIFAVFEDRQQNVNWSSF